MALDGYARKRDFSKTREPRGGPGRGAGKQAGKGPRSTRPARGLTYVIQEHHASHHHFDLRLEHKGVLLSWAVPKGPSDNPSVKRLAVRVEDHPLEYASFEGTIPAGQYGAGTVKIWDRGTWTPIADGTDSGSPSGTEGAIERGLRKGHLKFALHGKRLSGEWHLVRSARGSAGERASSGEKEHWLWFPASSGHTPRKRPEAPAATSRGAPAPGAVRRAFRDSPGVMLATLASKPPQGDAWAHEVKFDGYRALAIVDRRRRDADASVRMLTRSGLDWTARLGALARALARSGLPGCVLDGEVVALSDAGLSDFGLLQRRLKGGRSAGEGLTYYVFDILWHDGWDVRPCTLRSRRALLERIWQRAGLATNAAAGVLRLSAVLAAPAGDGSEVLSRACGLGMEGVVSKRWESAYQAGRSGDWIKSKCSLRQEFVVGGYTEPKGASRAGLGALLLGVYEGSRLVPCGRVGTGFDARTLRSLRSRLSALKTVTPAFAASPLVTRGERAHWVSPTLVAEVKFTGWTRDGVLRHPSFVGLRDDKLASDVRRERTLEDAAVLAGIADDQGLTRGVGPSAPRRTRTSSRTSRGAPRRGAQKAEVAGVRLTHPGKVLWPDAGVTKLELARYYEALGDRVLAHVVHRPLALVRCPEGSTGACFFQKHRVPSMPAEIGSVDVAQAGESPELFVMIRDMRGLIALVQLGALELHPWGSKADHLEHPDRLIFDLDPGPGVPWQRVRDAATAIREELASRGLGAWVKTSGGKGLHIVTDIEPDMTWHQAKAFTRDIAEELVRREPTRYVANIRKSKREGRILVDYLRNGRGATSVAAYSTRARAGAPVSMPFDWKDLDSVVRGDQWTVRDTFAGTAMTTATTTTRRAGRGQPARRGARTDAS